MWKFKRSGLSAKSRFECGAKIKIESEFLEFDSGEFFVLRVKIDIFVLHLGVNFLRPEARQP